MEKTARIAKGVEIIDPIKSKIKRRDFINGCSKKNLQEVNANYIFLYH